jgi:hypothetical protein
MTNLPDHHRQNSLPMQEARKVMKKLRDCCKTGKVAAFVVQTQRGTGYRVSLCDVGPDNPVWKSASKCDLRMKRLAGVYTERAHLEWIADDLHALGLKEGGM